jgi:hypothetical protein
MGIWPEQTWAHKEMARPEGFEPPTNGFGSHYSIQLSYGRIDGSWHRTATRWRECCLQLSHEALTLQN